MHAGTEIEDTSKAHQVLDRAVDAACIAAEKAAGRRASTLGTDAGRVAFLFERYQALTRLLPAAKPKAGRRRAAWRGGGAAAPSWPAFTRAALALLLSSAPLRKAPCP